jgi:hypothetical protein
MNKGELIRLFKDRLEAFLNVLIDQFPTEKDLVMLQLVVRGNVIDSEKALFNFTKIILPHKEMVLNKDEEFFLSKCGSLLSGSLVKVKSDTVDHFKRIWTSDTLTKEDRENLWRWFKLVLNIAIEYDKQK